MPGSKPARHGCRPSVTMQRGCRTCDVRVCRLCRMRAVR
jgi:hypothetical protein